MKNETLFIPLSFLKKISDDNYGHYEHNVDVEKFRTDYPDALGFFIEDIELQELWGIVESIHYATLHMSHYNEDSYVSVLQSVSSDQHHDIILFNELMSQVNDIDL